MTVLGPDVAPQVTNISLMQICKQCLEDERRHAEAAQGKSFLIELSATKGKISAATRSHFQETMVEAGLELGDVGDTSFEVTLFNNDGTPEATDFNETIGYNSGDSEDNNELHDANPIFSDYFRPASHS